jgi:hypothetical protein
MNGERESCTLQRTRSPNICPKQKGFVLSRGRMLPKPALPPSFALPFFWQHHPHYRPVRARSSSNQSGASWPITPPSSKRA